MKQNILIPPSMFMLGKVITILTDSIQMISYPLLQEIETIQTLLHILFWQQILLMEKTLQNQFALLPDSNLLQINIQPTCHHMITEIWENLKSCIIQEVMMLVKAQVKDIKQFTTWVLYMEMIKKLSNKPVWVKMNVFIQISLQQPCLK